MLQPAGELRRSARQRLAWLPGALVAASCARYGYELEGEAGQIPDLRLDQTDASPSGQGRRAALLHDLYASSRASASAEFFPGSLLQNVNSPAVDHMPSLSADELVLVFISQRDQGNNDIWTAERSQRRSAFGAARALPELNTSLNEESPALSAAGLELVFASDRVGGRGGLDLWRSTRARRQDAFSAPLNLSALNTADDEHEVALSADGVELFFVIDGDATTSVRLFHSLRSCLD